MEDVYRSQFRLPYPLYERLKEASDRSGRSLNAELVHRLMESLDSDRGGSVFSRGTVEGLADKLARPEHRGELESLVETICRLMDQEGRK